MTRRDFDSRLRRRAKRSGVSIDEPVVDLLYAYFSLLARWNLKINLTALPLNPGTDETFDRLFVEPLSALRYVQESEGLWVDLGSGGGSPAIPMKICRPSLRLTMVESKGRKAAFLREVTRALPLADAEVLNVRFEELAGEREWRHRAQLLSARAVRPDITFAEATRAVLADGGNLVLFHSQPRSPELRGFAGSPPVRLIEGGAAFLSSYRPVFHVEQSG